MAYTFTEKTGEVGASLFGGLANDANHQAMTGVTASGPQMKDATASPVISPATVATNATTTLTVPNNAATVTIITATNTINISESDNTVATNYVTLPVGTPLTLDVARCANLYLKANTGSATVSFFFGVV